VQLLQAFLTSLSLCLSQTREVAEHVGSLLLERLCVHRDQLRTSGGQQRVGGRDIRR